MGGRASGRAIHHSLLHHFWRRRPSSIQREIRTEIHIYVNEKEAGRRAAEGERERKVVMRHRRPPSLTRSHSNMLIPLPRRRSPSSSEDTDTTIMAGRVALSGEDDSPDKWDFHDFWEWKRL